MIESSRCTYRIEVRVPLWLGKILERIVAEGKYRSTYELTQSALYCLAVAYQNSHGGELSQSPIAVEISEMFAQLEDEGYRKTFEDDIRKRRA